MFSGGIYREKDLWHKTGYKKLWTDFDDQIDTCQNVTQKFWESDVLEDLGKM